MTVNGRGTIARVSLKKMRENVQLLRTKIDTKNFFCPMVKANAYGHGDVMIARELEKLKVSALGVISLDEALHLREAKIRSQILVFEAPEDKGWSDFLQNTITPVLGQWEQIRELESVAKNFAARTPLAKNSVQKPVAIHLKFNTGMNRLGFDIEQAAKLSAYFDSQKNLAVEGICTHFINGEDAGDKKGYTHEQLQRFALAEKHFTKFAPKLHVLNSASLLKGMGRKDLGARPGISVYGICPFAAQDNAGLQPILEVFSRIEHLQYVPRGGVVSYGPRWTAERDSLIGVIPIGYADGYYRALTNKTHLLYKNKKVQQVGTVCMDFIMIDLTGLEPKINDEVTVMGAGDSDAMTATELANRVGSIAYEFLTRLGPRIARIYIGGSK